MQQRNNIILRDIELEVLIRKIVREAKKKGYGIEEIKNAINVMYQAEEESNKEDNTDLLEVAKTKASKFVKDYLIGEFIGTYSTGEKIQAILACMVSMYVLFRSGKEVNITEIKEYSLKNQLAVKRECYWISNRTITSMHELFYERLEFNTDEKLHVCTKRTISSRTISSIKEFKEYSALHSDLNSDHSGKIKTMVAVAVTWVLDRYF